MSGYTPLFSSVLDGTLYGKWPHTGVWLCLLSQCDVNGHVDMVPRLLAAKIGVPEKLLLKCVHDFMQPDPGSRTGDMEGRRLELIDATNREWGWRVINHGLYREKARLKSKNDRDIADGKNAARMADRRRPPLTAADRPSDSDSDSDSDKNKKRQQKALRATRAPEGFSPDLDFARSQIPDLNAEEEAARFRDFEFKTPHSDWAATWRNWVRTCKESGKYAKATRNGAMIVDGQPVVWDR